MNFIHAKKKNQLKLEFIEEKVKNKRKETFSLQKLQLLLVLKK